MLEASSIADDREWAFIHALIKDVAYGRVPKGRRAQLHLRFADWLGERPDLADEVVEIVAYHLEQSCKLGSEIGRAAVPPPIERAIEALMRAAEKSSRREGIREADRYYARALDLVGDEQSERALELRLGRAGTLNLLGELGRADNTSGRSSRAPGQRGGSIFAQGRCSAARTSRGSVARRRRPALRRGSRGARCGVERPPTPGPGDLRSCSCPVVVRGCGRGGARGAVARARDRRGTGRRRPANRGARLDDPRALQPGSARCRRAAMPVMPRSSSATPARCATRRG